MSYLRTNEVRSFLSMVPLLFRVIIIVGLAVLLISLLVPSAGGSGKTNYAFQSPGPSPPDPDPPGPPHSPPGQSHSPPGPFHSPPGHFKSPLPPHPGGAGEGLGPVRRITLDVSPDSIVYAPDASGVIKIFGKYPENHRKWANFPQSIDYSVSKLPCLDFVNYTYYGSGRWFYALYLITDTNERFRIQSFNPGCPDSSFKSWVQVPNLSEDLLLNQDLVFEVHIEWDDNWDSPDFYYGPTVILRGQDPN